MFYMCVCVCEIGMHLYIKYFTQVLKFGGIYIDYLLYTVGCEWIFAANFEITFFICVFLGKSADKQEGMEEMKKSATQVDFGWFPLVGAPLRDIDVWCK